MKIRNQVSQEVAPTNQTKLEDKIVINFARCPAIFYVVQVDMSILLRGIVLADCMH